MPKKLKAMYGLPSDVKFCSRCVISNQRPNSSIEFQHQATDKKRTIHFDEKNICDACRVAEIKEKTGWDQREKELWQLCDKYRKNNGEYDCIVPGSGGKDSAYAAWILKYKFGMHPLTVTWPPIIYTDYGYQNFVNWIEVGGFDNITYKPNGRAAKLLTRLAVENLLHPFQPFILGQKHIGANFALKYNTPLVFYGENETEYGNPIADDASSLRDKAYYTAQNLQDCYLGGVKVSELIEKYELQLNELLPYLPADFNEFNGHEINVHYLGYYLKWVPQECYYFAVEHINFQARPFRTKGSYSKYNSLDDKVDDFHYYTTYVKFGIGRATYDAAQEIRNHHLTRDEGVQLVKRFDGEFPDTYFKDFMDWIEMEPEYFPLLCDKFRSPHLWKKVDGEWKLRHNVWGEGTDD